MGTRTELTLNLNGLFPSIPCLPIFAPLPIFSGLLPTLAPLLSLLALGFLWRQLLLWLPTVGLFNIPHLQMRIPCQMILFLPPGLVLALLKAIYPNDLGASLWLVMADTGATDHMVPNCSAFISYKTVCHLCVRMGNTSYAPILGQGTAIISLKGRCLLIWSVLHVSTLRVPLYSLRAHLHQRGCGFVGSYDTGMHVYFPGVVLSMNTLTDCHLSYEPLGKSAPLSTLYYIQPRCPPIIYPDKGSAFLG
jgi:hypothetical protein